MKRKPSLSRTFFYQMTAVAFLSVSLLAALWMYGEYTKFEAEAVKIRTQGMETHKATLKKEIESVVNYINYMKDQAEDRLHSKLKERVYGAHALSSAIWEQNKGRKSKKEIENMVRESLRHIRFNNSEGVFFATRLDGTGELYTTRPELEGTSLLDFRDHIGAYIVRDLIKLIQNQNEGFYTYILPRSESEQKDIRKTSFVRYFEPFNWYIGTSEYIEDVETEIQKEVLDRVSRIRFQGDNYIFVGQWDGLTLLGPGKGRNMFEVQDSNGVKIVQELIARAKGDGGYVQYVMPKFKGQKNSLKISYAMGIKDWEWYVGAGTYIDDIETAILAKRVLLNKKLWSDTLKVGFIMTLILLCTSLVAMRTSRKTRTNYYLFAKFFKRAADESTRIEANQLNFAEFEDIAEFANQMLEDRWSADQARKQSEEKYRDILEEMDEGYFEADNDGNLTFFNQSFAEMTDLDSRDFRFNKPEEDRGGKEPEQFPEYLSDILHPSMSGQSIPFMSGPAGSKKSLELTQYLKLDQEGREIGFRGLVRDITEKSAADDNRRRLEAQLRRAEKMETVGTLAGGVAHDLNNILSGIVSYPELLLLDLPETSSLRQPLLTIQKSGHKAAAIVQDLLTLARRGVSNKTPVNINQTIREYLGSPEHLKLMSYAGKIRIESLLEPSPFNIMASPVHISKTIHNLVANATEAMPAGGEITISTSNQYIDRTMDGFEEISEGDYMVLTITDNGQGISESDLERIFEPFFTKKIMGRSGTGLGMAVVWGTVKDHQGHIDVESKIGSGATFTLYFPATREKTHSDPENVPIEEIQGQGQKILIIDDIQEQREIASRILIKLGYEAVTMASGEKALEYLKSEKVDLVLLDMIMDPGMDGLETYREIVKIYPLQRAVIASGFSETERVRETQKLGAGRYIKKPYTLEGIGLAIKEELRNERVSPKPPTGD